MDTPLFAILFWAVALLVIFVVAKIIVKVSPVRDRRDSGTVAHGRCCTCLRSRGSYYQQRRDGDAQPR